MSRTIKTYSELSKFETFDERFEYLKLEGRIGEETFGFDRYVNQIFYRSREWQSVRNRVIIRDNGCDLGVLGHEIRGKILIHHINPITERDILERSEFLLNPEYLITAALFTHNAIHYGSREVVGDILVERKKNDTCPWKN